jgi:hypothetical protein
MQVSVRSQGSQVIDHGLSLHAMHPACLPASCLLIAHLSANATTGCQSNSQHTLADCAPAILHKVSPSNRRVAVGLLRKPKWLPRRHQNLCLALCWVAAAHVVWPVAASPGLGCFCDGQDNCKTDDSPPYDVAEGVDGHGQALAPVADTQDTMVGSRNFELVYTWQGGVTLLLAMCTVYDTWFTRRRAPGVLQPQCGCKYISRRIHLCTSCWACLCALLQG